MKKILVIDDVRNIRLTVSLCLEQAGYEVLQASDGLNGLQLALEQLPDIVILDIILPKMNGYLVCEALKSEKATSNIPVIIISAKAENEDISRAREAGADDYIIKPFSPEALRKMIKKYIGER